MYSSEDDFAKDVITPAANDLFQPYGMVLNTSIQNTTFYDSSGKPEMYFGLILSDPEHCVLTTVRRKLDIEDINEHLDRMEKFKPLLPEYANKKVYGAVAAMVIPDDVAKYAYRKGFFIIAQKGEMAVMLNDDKFRPVAW